MPRFKQDHKNEIQPIEGTTKNIKEMNMKTIETKSIMKSLIMMLMMLCLEVSARTINTPTISKFSSGPTHNLMITEDGSVMSWGNGSSGKLGIGDNGSKLSPAKIENLKDVIAVRAGQKASIALKKDGTVWFWGALITGSSPVPIQVAGLEKIVSIKIGNEHALALKEDGTVWAWGDNTLGQIGAGSGYRPNKTPVMLTTINDVKEIYATPYSSFFVKHDGTTWGAGLNHLGQLGAGSTDAFSIIPIRIPELNNVVDLSGGENYTVAATADGSLWTTGSNETGQLGVSQKSDLSYKTFTKNWHLDGLRVYRVSGNDHSVYALTAYGLFAWGLNDIGQLAVGIPNNMYIYLTKSDNYTYAARSFPVPSKEFGYNVTDIYTGKDCAFVLNDYGNVSELWAVGNNSGNFGDGSLESSSSPIYTGIQLSK